MSNLILSPCGSSTPPGNKAETHWIPFTYWICSHALKWVCVQYVSYLVKDFKDILMPQDGMVETKKLAVTGSQIQGAQLDLPVLYQLNRTTGWLSAYIHNPVLHRWYILSSSWLYDWNIQYNFTVHTGRAGGCLVVTEQMPWVWFPVTAGISLSSVFTS